MSSERLRQIEELYHSAKERGAAVLTDADPELRREVERLLAQDSESGDKLLDQSAARLLAGMRVSQVESGSLLGPYRIEAPLGEGGMGQVFRARDTRLDRTVAIKVLKEWSGRFEKESRAIAALNHPYICTLHDVGPNYLVMELIQGETLAARLKRGSLPMEQAIQYGTQIAEALAAAHAAGIIHRDLKPANVMLTKSGVKVLDFGLAKSTADPAVSTEGALMGTPAYMAPEQFEGKAADARTDIYALGLILRDMVGGTRDGLPETTPPSLARLVKRCLQNDPDERWQSARDLRWELESVATAPAPSSSRASRTPLFLALGLVLLLAAIVAYALLRNPSPPQPLARLTVQLPEKSRVLSMALSPDGRALALVLVKDGRQQIWVRELDALEPSPLEGTDNALNPFWSPDGRSIAFFADARLKKIDRSGGPVQTVCDAMAATGGAWSRNGDILIAGLYGMERVSSSGGIASQLPENAGLRGDYPYFLPDGDHYLATRNDGVWLGAMDSTQVRQIVPDVSNAQFMGPPSGSRIGALIFTRGSALMALPFDVKRLEPAEDAFAIAHEIARGLDFYRLVAASNAGVLAYVAGQQGDWQFVWRDRAGRILGSLPDAGGVAMISPDGKSLAFRRAGDTWVMEFARGLANRLTFGRTSQDPIWSPDGRYVAYAKAGLGIYRKLATGAGNEELLVASKTLAVPKSWSPDGNFLVYALIKPGTGADLMAISVNGDRKPFPVVQANATADQGQFSPDGHWLAYTSNESGQAEIYVIPFPPTPGAKWLVSRGGGVQARWNRNGKELFYISSDSKMMSVAVATRPIFQSGMPRPLFQSDIVDTGLRNGPMSWDIAPDGNRFLIISPNTSDTPALTVTLNWRPDAAK
jgi:eukaryotic-like serine/threonine-protein kinase